DDTSKVTRRIPAIRILAGTRHARCDRRTKRFARLSHQKSQSDELHCRILARFLPGAFLIIKRLEELEHFGIKLGLENIRALLGAIGEPQTWYPSILIAGTNGKGSVGAMLAKILQTHGFRTGHYTSPHLIDVRERIAVDGEPITPDAFETELTSVFE